MLALLAACAYISGPCSVKLGQGQRQAHCEAGGFLFLVPPKILEAITPNVETSGGTKVGPGMDDSQEKSRP